MWALTVRASSFDQQVEATAKAGFDVLTLPYRTYLAEKATGRTAEDLVTVARNSGVEIDYFDGMSGWAPQRYPTGDEGFLRAALDFGAEETLDLCARTGMRHIVAIAGFEAGRLETDVLIDAFATFCDQAADLGIWVDLEPMPMLGIPTLGMAWDIVRGAGRSNSAVLLDTWHFMRGGADFALLESMPRGSITNLQIADGLAEAPTEDLWDDASHNREFPGLGALPIQKILGIVARTQDVHSIGPEAMSDRIDQLTPEQLGLEARATLDNAAIASGLLSASPPTAL
jgi:sugar phosphate isomerase/epimerase